MAISTAVQPMTSFANVLYNASFATTHPTKGAVTTLAAWYASATNFYNAGGTGGTSSATPTVTAADGIPIYTFTVPGSCPINEQYEIAIDGFVAANSAISPSAGYPVSGFYSYVLGPGNTYVVSVGVLDKV